jgi:hypothetical protein
MKKPSMILPFFRHQPSLPAAMQHLITNRFSELVALAQHGHHNGGRGVVLMTDDGSVRYVLARELRIFLGIKGRMIQAAVGTYRPEREIVMCLLVTNRPPYGLVFQQDALAPFESAQHLLAGQLAIIPSA